DGPLDPRSWIDRSAAIEPSIARPLSLHLARRVGRTRQGAGRLRQPVMLLASPGLGPAPNLPGVRDSFTDECQSDRDHQVCDRWPALPARAGVGMTNRPRPPSGGAVLPVGSAVRTFRSQRFV